MSGLPSNGDISDPRAKAANWTAVIKSCFAGMVPNSGEDALQAEEPQEILIQAAPQKN
jgi:hypothetical protein